MDDKQQRLKMPYQTKRAKEVKSLGSQNTKYSFDYDASLLEVFDNLHQDKDYWVTLNCDEFSALCPITNQPDFGTIIINYIPNIKMVESKSLKLYLFSFINSGEFHEDVVNKIAKDLVKVMKPKYLEVLGLFYPRGNISIHPYSSYHNGKKKYKKIDKQRFTHRNINPQRVG